MSNCWVSPKKMIQGILKNEMVTLAGALFSKMVYENLCSRNVPLNTPQKNEVRSFFVFHKSDFCIIMDSRLYIEIIQNSTIFLNRLSKSLMIQ
jgi:hypothetical protein